LAWLLRDAPGAEYMKQARECGLAVGFVSVTERKNVVDWLEGKIPDHEKIVSLVGEQLCSFEELASGLTNVVESTTPPGSPQRSGATAALPSTPGAGLAEPTISPSKRRYIADNQDVEVVKKIKQNEVELRDRNTVLRGTKANVSTSRYEGIFIVIDGIHPELLRYPYSVHRKAQKVKR